MKLITFCFVLLVSIYILSLAESVVIKLTNLECKEFDKPFATIPICKLKLVQRGVVAMDLLVKLHQVPVNNVSINSQLLKKANGYRPFLYNVSQDFCRFMKNSKRYPYLNIYMSVLAKHSNVNHTCPYNHDIIIKHMILKHEMFKLLPLPYGDYLLISNVFAYNDLKAAVKMYITVSGKI